MSAFSTAYVAPKFALGSTPAGPVRAEPHSHDGAVAAAGTGHATGVETRGEPLDRATLAAKLAFIEALHRNRFDGTWNLGVNALSRLPFGGRNNRKQMETSLDEARMLLGKPDAARAGPLTPELAARVAKSLEDAYQACRRFDRFIDNATECGTTIVTGFFAKWYWERISARHEVQHGKRLESTFSGEWLQQFPFLSGVYFATMAASRGRNFVMEVQPDLSLKMNWSWIIGEIIAIPIMVGGTNRGGRFIRDHTQVKDKFYSELLAAIPSGALSSLQCYALVNKHNMHSSGSKVLFATLRGALFNTPMRFVLGGLLRGRETRLAKEWAAREGIPDLSAVGAATVGAGG